MRNWPSCSPQNARISKTHLASRAAHNSTHLASKAVPSELTLDIWDWLWDAGWCKSKSVQCNIKGLDFITKEVLNLTKERVRNASLFLHMNATQVFVLRRSPWEQIAETLDFVHRMVLTNSALCTEPRQWPQATIEPRVYTQWTAADLSSRCSGLRFCERSSSVIQILTAAVCWCSCLCVWIYFWQGKIANKSTCEDQRDGLQEVADRPPLSQLRPSATKLILCNPSCCSELLKCDN